MTFAPEYPGATVIPAHPDNYGGYNRSNWPRAIVLHTPEEPADDIEVTPAWFQRPEAHASTHYYLDNDGDIIQMVQEAECAWANGNKGGAGGNRTWKGQRDQWPPWAEVGVSLNCQTVSIEIEGYAASIQSTLTSTQYAALLAWIRFEASRWGIPLDRDHIIGHFEVATDRTDPGAGFPWTRLMDDLSPPPAPAPSAPLLKIRLEPVGAPTYHWTDDPAIREQRQKIRIIQDA